MKSSYLFDRKKSKQHRTKINRQKVKAFLTLNRVAVVLHFISLLQKKLYFILTFQLFFALFRLFSSYIFSNKQNELKASSTMPTATATIIINIIITDITTNSNSNTGSKSSIPKRQLILHCLRKLQNDQEQSTVKNEKISGRLNKQILSFFLCLLFFQIIFFLSLFHSCAY